ncbi:RIP metalloprotease RseP [Aquimarina sp. AD10]|uniref:Zinc metalloprotease n=1 Tax=Aquimarina aggregata TaxID=1642818 RepID=A0A162WKV0_9FLAO|nr:MULTISPECIES: RIP metalloprotease RseP [Aquimarina]AXT61539.1 RIP metalloprotease RseP [Aquimarina sp. AD10]KZS38165.1 RIP metalloprotease RseP [Aquimarina aggregata]RKM90022.1 RIP metalloprotease RseP [Aquimarina sp. AD10]
MSPFFIKAIQLLLSLSILIVLHELGHFIPAKLFKTRVEKFYLFFDVKYSLFKKKIGETVYGIGWLPLGGYVKIAGMIDESMDKEQMAGPPQPWEFRSKPAWQRLIIMLGGVTVNFILAIIIYIGIAYSYGDIYIQADSLKDGFHVTNQEIGDKLGIQTGDNILAIDGTKIEEFGKLPLEIINGNIMTIQRDGRTFDQEIPVDFIAKLLESDEKTSFLSVRVPFIINEISAGSHNTGADLSEGDRIVAINGNKVAYYDEIVSFLENNKNSEASFTVSNENGSEKIVSLKINEEAKLGLSYLAAYSQLEKYGAFSLKTIKYSFLESIPAGIHKGTSTLSSYVKQMKKIFNPSTGAYKGVGGFGAIGGLFPDTWNWGAFWSTTAFISIILAFMNILPIPALDGGHVMFLLYEIITGRKPNDKFMEYAQLAGFIILITLLLFANGNDIYKAVFG